jgi:hypothetical protein
MATNKDPLQIFPLHHTKHSLARLAGLFSLLFMLSGCQTALSPEQVTTAFWDAMAQGDIESAKKHATQETQHLVVKQQNLEGASIKTGTIVINGPNAKVATVITLKNPESNKILSFDTVLLKENDLWKADYQQTLNNLSILPLGEVFKNLREIGDAINKELGQQIPFFENQIKSFSEELIRQMDEFRRQLEKASPPKQPPPGVI